MVKISQYEQNQLSSPAVGTPGVDTSNAQVLGQMASGFGGLATNINQYAAQINTQQQADLREKQKNMEEIVKAQVKMAQDVEIANRSLEMNIKLHELSVMERDNNKESPDAVPQTVMKMGKDAIQEYADSVSDPVVKAGILKNGAASLDNHVNASTTWMVEQKTKLAFNHATNARQSLIAAAGNPALTPDLKSLQVLHQQAKDLIGPNSLLFGEKAGTIMQDTIEEMNISFLDAKLVTDPVGVENMLKSGAFGQGLSGKQKATIARSYEVKAHAAAMEKKKQDEIETRTTMVQHEADAFDIVANDDPGVTDAQKAVDLRKKAKDVKATAMAIAKGDGHSKPNPTLAKQMLNDAEQWDRQADTLENRYESDIKKGEAATEKEVKKKQAEFNKLKAERLNSPRGSEIRVKATQQLIDVLKDKNSPNYVKNLQTLNKNIAKWSHDGYVTPQWARAKMDIINAGIANKGKPKNPSLIDSVVKQAGKAVQWAQSLGAPKDKTRDLIDTQQHEYHRRLLFYQKAHNGQEPPAKVKSLMMEDSKESARRKHGHGP